jgi:hypothetical protein
MSLELNFAVPEQIPENHFSLAKTKLLNCMMVLQIFTSISPSIKGHAKHMEHFGDGRNFHYVPGSIN